MKNVLVFYINHDIANGNMQSLFEIFKDDFRTIVITHEGKNKVEFYKTENNISATDFNELTKNIKEFKKRIQQLEKIKPIEL